MVGAIRSLFLPGKGAGRPQDYVTYETYAADMRRLEIWARQPIQQLIAGSGVTLVPASGLATDAKGNGPNGITISSTGGGTVFYASLTGPGETNPAGTLVQTGDFVIQNKNLTVNGANFTNSITGGVNNLGALTNILFSASPFGGPISQQARFIVTSGAGSSLPTVDPCVFGCMGDGVSGGPIVQFLFTSTVPPTVIVSNPTFAFVTTGHIYFSSGGGVWNLLV